MHPWSQRGVLCRDSARILDRRKIMPLSHAPLRFHVACRLAACTSVMHFTVCFARLQPFSTRYQHFLVTGRLGMPTPITAQVHQVLRQLEADRKRLDEQIAALQHVVTLFDGKAAEDKTKVAAPTRPRTRRRRMSTQARRAVSARMKAYWAKRRAAKSAAGAKGK